MKPLNLTLHLSSPGSVHSKFLVQQHGHMSTLLICNGFLYSVGFSPRYQTRLKISRDSSVDGTRCDVRATRHSYYITQNDNFSTSLSLDQANLLGYSKACLMDRHEQENFSDTLYIKPQ